MTVVIETGGAQILPPVGDERATTTAWAARQADKQVGRGEEYAEMLARLDAEDKAEGRT